MTSIIAINLKQIRVKLKTNMIAFDKSFSKYSVETGDSRRNNENYL